MSAPCLDLVSLQPRSSLVRSLGPHAVDQALCLFGWDRTPEVFCRMDSRMHGFEGDAHAVPSCEACCAGLILSNAREVVHRGGRALVFESRLDSVECRAHARRCIGGNLVQALSQRSLVRQRLHVDTVRNDEQHVRVGVCVHDCVDTRAIERSLRADVTWLRGVAQPVDEGGRRAKFRLALEPAGSARCREPGQWRWTCNGAQPPQPVLAAVAALTSAMDMQPPSMAPTMAPLLTL